MKTIWKYQLQPTDEQTILMPSGASIISVQAQMEAICLWALVDPANAVNMVKRTFDIFGTGHPIDESPLPRTFVGTVQLAGGQLIFHVFEQEARPERRGERPEKACKGPGGAL